MQVINLKISNYMGIKAIDITPKDKVIRIEGKNEAGKSSIINSIWTTIGGADEMPDKPIRKGEKDASIFVDLGDITVERRFTDKGSYLDVRNKEGFKATSPQAMLDNLFTKVSMDPQAFIDMKPGERKELLLDLTGNRAEIEKFEDSRRDIFEGRALLNRDIKNLEGKLSDAPADEDIEEKSISELMGKLKEARKIDDNLNKMEAEVIQLRKRFEIEREAIKECEEHIKEFEGAIESGNTAIKDLLNKAEHIEKVIANAPGSKVDTIENEIADADAFNLIVRAIKAGRELRTELEKVREQAKQYTVAIKKVDQEKLDLLKKADLPLDNLTVNDSTILIGDIPFDDLSNSEQIKTSMLIGIAFNPKLRVLRISKGREFDSESQAQINDFAEKNDCQIWMECVTDDQEDGIFIKDGEIVECKDGYHALAEVEKNE